MWYDHDSNKTASSIDQKRTYRWPLLSLYVYKCKEEKPPEMEKIINHPPEKSETLSEK